MTIGPRFEGHNKCLRQSGCQCICPKEHSVFACLSALVVSFVSCGIRLNIICSEMCSSVSSFKMALTAVDQGGKMALSEKMGMCNLGKQTSAEVELRATTTS